MKYLFLLLLSSMVTWSVFGQDTKTITIHVYTKKLPTDAPTYIPEATVELRVNGLEQSKGTQKNGEYAFQVVHKIGNSGKMDIKVMKEGYETTTRTEDIPVINNKEIKIELKNDMANYLWFSGCVVDEKNNGIEGVKIFFEGSIKTDKPFLTYSNAEGNFEIALPKELKESPGHSVKIKFAVSGYINKVLDIDLYLKQPSLLLFPVLRDASGKGTSIKLERVKQSKDIENIKKNEKISQCIINTLKEHGKNIIIEELNEADLEKIEVINMSDLPIKSLKDLPLHLFKNLYSIKLTNTLITNFEGIERLEKVREIYMEKMPKLKSFKGLEIVPKYRNTKISVLYVEEGLFNKMEKSEKERIKMNIEIL